MLRARASSLYRIALTVDAMFHTSMEVARYIRPSCRSTIFSSLTFALMLVAVFGAAAALSCKCNVVPIAGTVSAVVSTVESYAAANDLQLVAMSVTTAVRVWSSVDIDVRHDW